MLEDGDTGGGEEDNDCLDTENLTATAAGLHHKTKFCSRNQAGCRVTWGYTFLE